MSQADIPCAVGTMFCFNIKTVMSVLETICCLPAKICHLPKPRSTGMSEPANIRKAQSLADKILLLNAVTARNSLWRGTKRGQILLIAIWNNTDTMPALSIEAMQNEDLMNSLPFTKV